MDSKYKLVLDAPDQCEQCSNTQYRLTRPKKYVQSLIFLWALTLLGVLVFVLYGRLHQTSPVYDTDFGMLT